MKSYAGPRIERIHVTDILGEDFFCRCEKPKEGWVLHQRESPFKGFPGHAWFAPRCQRCDRPIYDLMWGNRDREAFAEAAEE